MKTTVIAFGNFEKCRKIKIILPCRRKILASCVPPPDSTPVLGTSADTYLGNGGGEMNRCITEVSNESCIKYM